MQAHLLRFVTTATQCGVLGLLIYMATSEAARFPGVFIGVLGSALSGVSSILLAREIIEALLTRVAPVRPMGISRHREPFWYWGWLLFHAMCLTASLALLVWSLLLFFSELAAEP